MTGDHREVDKISGRRGAPKSAAFGTADIVGSTRPPRLRPCVREPHGRSRSRALPPPPFVKEMVKRGLLGRKAAPASSRWKGRETRREVTSSTTAHWSTARRRRSLPVPRRGEGRGGDGAGSGNVSGDDKAAKYAWTCSPTRCSTPRSGSGDRRRCGTRRQRD